MTAFLDVFDSNNVHPGWAIGRIRIFRSSQPSRHSKLPQSAAEKVRVYQTLLGLRTCYINTFARMPAFVCLD
jgi:hypothetical protein